jgi:hypothetical protein
MQSPLDHVIVWDLETVPDLPCVARVNGFDESDEEAAREKLGEKFPKLIFHKIVCIGGLIAERVEGIWIVRSLGAPNIVERSEAETSELMSSTAKAGNRTARCGDTARLHRGQWQG